MLVLPLGLLAGGLTTVAGVGGGMLLTLVLSVLWDPQLALATTAPALLLGNAHRLLIFRRSLDRRVALSFGAGALPGAFAGGILAVGVPAEVLRWLILGVTAVALGRHLGLFRFDPPRTALLPAGGLAGLLTATTGGGGLLVAPMLLATGLRAEAYVATGAATAIAMHVGRIAAYGTGGLITAETAAASAILAAAILGGNLAGRRLRERFDEPTKMRIAWGVLLVAVVVGVVGAMR